MNRKRISAFFTIVMVLAVILSLSACGEDKPCLHKDVNQDGRCDNCDLVIAVYLDLFAVNDLHGKIFDTSDQPGVDELTTYLKGYAANGNSVVLSSGDMWQGSSESNLIKGNMMTEWMNELNFVSMTLGNHEFDWGEEKISDNLAIADFPFLAINVRKRSTGEIADYFSRRLRWNAAESKSALSAQ